MSGPYDGIAPPQATGSFKAGPIGKIAAIFVCATALCQVLLAVSDLREYVVFKDNLQGWDPDAISAIEVAYVVAGVAAAVTFISWLRQVRSNAERFCKAPHRRSRGWVIGGWFVPIVSFWFPKQIVDDIVAASSSRTSPHADDLPRLRASVVQTWWATWIASNVVSFADPTFLSDQPAAGDLLRTASVTTACAVLTVVCAVYAVRVIQLVNNLQASRPWAAWWEVSTTSTGQGDRL